MFSKGKIFRLGITGGIGSGKTSVCKVFEMLGVPVFSADPVARDIMDHDEKIIDNINAIIGRDLYRNGGLDRAVLANLIFNDRELLEKVNSIVHPEVFRRFDEWAAGQNAAYVIMEAAILFESGASEKVDRVLTVTAPVEERIARVMHRNNLSREQVLERINNQMPDDERIRLSDYVISNSERDMIIPEILEIHNRIISITQAK
ncbi:MAG TPA: dephospho-CoA kinase [Bacteroidales bacterium]|nr:dephospho-CoA kinase [Bacteroidales bacterium]